MAWGYQHYEVDRYVERAFRRQAQARLQVWLDNIGLYTNVSITPVATPSTDARPFVAQQVFAPDPAHAYLNPDGRKLGFEWLVWDDTAYTITLQIDSQQHTLSIPALPISPTPIFTVQQSVPYTIGGLAGWLLHGVLNGQYQSGGVVIDTPNRAEHVAAQISVRHNLYRDAQGRWRLQLYNADGTEYNNMTLLKNLPLTLTIWSRFR